VDQYRFDALTRALSGVAVRRNVLRGLTGACLGLSGARLAGIAEARKKPKNKPKPTPKPKPNKYGCFNVGAPCKRAGQCCSSLCEGKPGKQTCRAHGTGICKQGGPGACAATSVEDLAKLACDGTRCFCFRTTAGSNFCSGGPYTDGSSCADCKTDADCEALGFPAGSACAPSKGICGVCASGTACLAPCGPETPPAATP
jgi:hypothetical protein